MPTCLTECPVLHVLLILTDEMLFTFAVRAGTGGDEAGIWAGDLVGTCFFFPH